jgi:hypothetical protein
MTPVFTEKTRAEQGGGYLNAFADPEDIARIAAGYACGNCCAIFSMYTPTCPVCHTTRDVNLDIKGSPADWQAYWDQHNYGSGTTETNTIDDALKAISENPNVEQIPVSKMLPPKWGRGRPK